MESTVHGFCALMFCRYLLPSKRGSTEFGERKPERVSWCGFRALRDHLLSGSPLKLFIQVQSLFGLFGLYNAPVLVEGKSDNHGPPNGSKRIVIGKLGLMAQWQCLTFVSRGSEGPDTGRNPFRTKLWGPEACIPPLVVSIITFLGWVYESCMVVG